MLERYSAPLAEDIFSGEQKVSGWRRITDMYAVASIVELEEQADHGTIIAELYGTKTPTFEAVTQREKETGHDVVAFLALYTEAMPDHVKRHIHRGLTSSDLVEFHHHETMRRHQKVLANSVSRLASLLRQWELVNTARLGRTHGQIAAPTSWHHQMQVIRDVLLRIEKAMRSENDWPLIKSPGPTGTSPWVLRRTHQVADAAVGQVVQSTQMIPRDYQIEWGAIYVRLAGALENLALQVRLASRSEVSEVREGASKYRIGSSAMPHKLNPIASEKVCGLARVARGYFATLAEGSAFWEDRDLTNSSMERIVVPDLAAVVEHMVATMTSVISDLEYLPRPQAFARADVWSNLMQAKLQEVCRMGPIEAGGVVRGAFRATDEPLYSVVSEVHAWVKDRMGMATATEWLNAVNDITKGYV